MSQEFADCAPCLFVTLVGRLAIERLGPTPTGRLLRGGSLDWQATADIPRPSEPNG